MSKLSAADLYVIQTVPRRSLQVSDPGADIHTRDKRKSLRCHSRTDGRDRGGDSNRHARPSDSGVV